MLTHRVVLALNDLLHNAQQGVANTSFVEARQGKNVGNNKGVICSTTNPLIGSFLLTLKDGLEELGDELEESSSKEVTRSRLVAKLREKLSICISLLECELDEPA